jgi:hypothetical protein
MAVYRSAGAATYAGRHRERQNEADGQGPLFMRVPTVSFIYRRTVGTVRR